VSPKTTAKVAAFAAFAAIVTAACTNSREGERCDVKNGNDDCAEGLKCMRAGELSNVTSDRCCPVDTTTATAPACVVAQVSVSGDSGTSTPFDSGASETGIVDAADAGDAGDTGSSIDAPSNDGAQPSDAAGD
jgi:hypothetical protein